jgi:Zn-dependent protease with chaperone function
VLQPLTVLILGWVIYTLIQTGQTLLNGLFSGLFWIPVLSAIRFAIDPTWIVIIGLIALFSASPWLLDGLLQQFYQLQPMSLSQLEHYSLESVRLLKRVSHQRRRPVPGLSVLPLAAPIAFSYGALPQLARIAVSQGLLEQLRDDEIAAIYAAELGHLDHWDVGVLSGLVLVAQLPYRVYWAAATWGNQQSNRALQSLAVLGSSIGYGCYWCCRLTGLWLSRVRLYYSDRRATNLTGNPNGLTRALLKVTIGIAAEIQRQGYTHPLLESFDLLMPVTPAAALTLGSLYPHMPTSALMTWDRSHPYRRWFASVSSHPLLGDRLYRLSGYGQRWHLEPELEWGQSVGQAAHSNRQTPAFRRLLLQIAPLVGALVGLAIGLVLGLLGWATYQARSYSFDWLWYGREAIVWGCVLLGFGIGLLIQINPAFGDLPRSSHQPEPDLAELVSDFNLLPIDSTPVRFQGKLLGRCHLLNRCYQDLMLQTSFGLVRLHYTSRGGVLGNLCSQSQRPTDLIQPNETVSVTGWFRRGATPWIDVDTIQTKRGITVRSGYPIWLTIVAITSALWGVYTIFRG